MKNFLIQLFLFGFAILFIFIGILFITNKKIDNSSLFQLSENNKYLVLGHSHPECAFNDSLIPNLKNISKSGELYFYTYLKARKLLTENKHIKVLFLEFSNHAIINRMEEWTKSDIRIESQIPKYEAIMDNDDCNYIINKNPIAFIKSMPLVFKNNINTILFNYKDYIVSYELGKYYRNKRADVDSLLKVENSRIMKNDFSEFNGVNLFYFNKIIKYCADNSIELYLIRSPFHKQEPIFLANESKFQTLLKTKFGKQTFLDFKDFPLLNEDYSDLDHLNYKGAKKFSLFFNNLLKKGLLLKINKQEFINQEMQKQSRN